MKEAIVRKSKKIEGKQKKDFIKKIIEDHENRKTKDQRKRTELPLAKEIPELKERIKPE